MAAIISGNPLLLLLFVLFTIICNYCFSLLLRLLLNVLLFQLCVNEKALFFLYFFLNKILFFLSKEQRSKEEVAEHDDIQYIQIY